MSLLPAEINVNNTKKLTLRELDPGDVLDLIEAGGSALSGMAADNWFNYAQMICSVSGINGVPVQMPTSKEEIKDLARRIGNDGVKAIQSLFSSMEEQDDQIASTAKN